MTREVMDTILGNLKRSDSSEDALLAEHIENVMVSNDLEPWEEVQEYLKSSLEELQESIKWVLQHLPNVRVS